MALASVERGGDGAREGGEETIMRELVADAESRAPHSIQSAD